MSDEQDRLRARLSLLVPINNLPPKSQDEILKKAEMLEFRRKDHVFMQGERDNWSFYVLDGVVELHADDQLIKTVTGGEAASFHALAQLQPRQMSARAKSRVTVLRVDRLLLDKLLSMEGDAGPPEQAAAIEVSEIDATGPTDWLTAILQSELFARIPPSNIQRMLETLESVEFKAGDVVVRQGDPGDYYYAIQTGTCVVTRKTTNDRELKLAELGPGDTFGEEALVSNAKRNASVTMATDGELARLTKKDFLDLITKPLLDTVSLEEARAHVAAGAVWLDVRFPEEHETNGIEGSINIPKSFLRTRCDELSPDRRYVVYCDTGGRSSAAAFLLAQRGFDVCYVEGGAIREVPEKPAAERPAPAAPPLPAAPAVEEPSEAALAAESRAQSLAADLEMAKLQIEQAQRLMQEAEATKREAERIVEQKLKTEREKLDREAQRVQAALAEAQRLKNDIEAQQKIAAEEAARCHREQEERIATRQREAEARLQEEELRLEEVYRKQAEQLERLEEEQTKSKEELAQAWKALEIESTQTRERLEAAKRLELELQEKERQQLMQIEQAEQELRRQLKHELETERHRLEAEFARTAEEVEEARRERAAAENARRAAEAEARKIVDEYKEQQQRLVAKYEAQVAAERRKLEAEADRLRTEMEGAARAKDEAEAAKCEAEKQLEEVRQKHVAVDAGTLGATTEIAAMEQRVELAALQLREAIAAELTVEDRQRENERRLERTYNSKTEINQLLQKELEEWVTEQERAQSLMGRRHELDRQHVQTERIRAHAVKARRDKELHNKALLDEIAEQLSS